MFSFRYRMHYKHTSFYGISTYCTLQILNFFYERRSMATLGCQTDEHVLVIKYF